MIVVWNQVLIVAMIGLSALIAVSNLYILRRLGSYPPPARYPRVSVLVPARNEEANIETNVCSLLAQQYPDFQVIVLDDNSEDGTPQILAELARSDARLSVIHGQPLPEGWMGKHWACQQLAEAADGELLFYTDADTRHSPPMLAAAVSALLAEDSDMLSGLPQEETGTWAERLIVPVMMWGIMGIIPLALAYRLRTPMLATAIGQSMLFKRSAFEAIGGFAAVRQEVLDDIALARRIKSQGYRWRLASARAFTRCRMYHNAREVFAGFGKNLFATVGNNKLLAGAAYLGMAIVFLEPVALLALSAAGVAFSPVVTALAALAVALSVLLFAISHRRFGFGTYLALLYPVTVLLTTAIALASIVMALTGRSSWKGRALYEPKAKPQ